MGLEFQNISHAYGSNGVLKGINLVAERGEVTCLVGPSGCGKTTLLKLAAGLLSVQQGRVTLDSQDLATSEMSLPPENRPIGLVFQEGALFPHMTVADNIAFGLSGSAAEKKARVAELLGKIGLDEFGARYPHTLSGGQQQRIALARALAPSPAVLLLDEPFANIDSQLRRNLREETRRMLRESGAVAILVTHDPDEALEMGDKIAVLDAGEIIQCDVPQALFDRPANADVAQTFGHGQSLKANVTPSEAIETGFGVWDADCLTSDCSLNGAVELVARQDSFDLSDGGDNMVVDIRHAGKQQLVFVEGHNGDYLRVEVLRDQTLHVGGKVSVSPLADTIHWYPEKS